MTRYSHVEEEDQNMADLHARGEKIMAPTLEEALDDLLPCPFCGGEAEIVHIEDGENAGGSCVSCKRCMASSNVEFEFKENFVSNWNRRAAQALAAPREREGLSASRNGGETLGATPKSAATEEYSWVQVHQRAMAYTRLVDAAPALLEAAHDLVVAMDAVLARPDAEDRRVHAKWFADKARAAIAKAQPPTTLSSAKRADHDGGES